MRRFLLSALVFALAACGGTQTSAQGASSQQAPQQPDAVVAEVGGHKVTLKELDEKWQSFDPAERARVTQLLYQNRRNVLDQLLGDLLIEDAAKAANISSQQYLEQETKKRLQPVTDADLKQLFEANKDRVQGRTFDELRQSMTAFLESQRQQQARAQLVDELKTKRGKDVKVLLDPPRQAVTIEANDPTLGPANAPVTIIEFSDYQ